MRAEPRPQQFRSKIKKWLTESPLSYSRTLDMVNRLGLLNDWRKNQRGTYFEQRFELYDHLKAAIIGDQPITYLEFGVYKGASIGHWSKIDSHPDSEFVGFDTFEGLPEAWDAHIPKLHPGHFSTHGEVPVTA